MKRSTSSVSLRALQAGLVVVTLLGASMLAKPASAADSGSLSISPAVQNLVALTAQQSLEYSVTVTNNTATELVISPSAHNFSTIGSNGQLVFTDTKAADANHGLARRMAFDSADFNLASHQSKTVLVTITSLESLPAGGQYGAVLFETRPAVISPVSGRQVTLNQSVASLVFLTTQGKGRYGLEQLPVKSAIASFTLPQSYNLVFKNTGNVQVTPRGYLSVTDPFGKQVARATLNPDSGLVLPQTDRLLQTASRSTRQALWPGIYTVHSYSKYDGAANFSVQTSRFLYLNLALMLPVVLITAAVFYSLIRFRRSITKIIVQCFKKFRP